MKRALRVSGFIVVYFLIMAGLIWLTFLLPAYSEIQSTAETEAIAFSNLFMLCVFLIYRGLLLWVPSVAVTAVSLFVPEIIGLPSHTFQGR